jgi:hypothetical protein
VRRGVHPHDRVPFVLVGIVAAITVLLVGGLAVALVPSRPLLALGATVAVCAPFGGIIAWGLHRTRVRVVLEPLPADAEPVALGGAAFALDLTDETRALRTERVRDARWGRIFAAVTAIVVGGAVGAGTVWWVGLALGGLLLALLPWMTGGDRARTAALSVARDSAPVTALTIHDDGLVVPVELLSATEQRHALEAGVLEVRLSWGAISRWEVRGAHGDVAAMHVLTMAAAGDGMLSPRRRVGVLRTPVLRAHESALLAAVRRHLRCGVEVQGDP